MTRAKHRPNKRSGADSMSRHAHLKGNCSIVLLTGMTKPIRTAFSRADYQQVRDLGDAYRASDPRRVAAG